MQRKRPPSERRQFCCPLIRHRPPSRRRRPTSLRRPPRRKPRLRLRLRNLNRHRQPNRLRPRLPAGRRLSFLRFRQRLPLNLTRLHRLLLRSLAGFLEAPSPSLLPRQPRLLLPQFPRLPRRPPWLRPRLPLLRPSRLQSRQHLPMRQRLLNPSPAACLAAPRPPRPRRPRSLPKLPLFLKGRQWFRRLRSSLRLRRLHLHPLLFPLRLIAPSVCSAERPSPRRQPRQFSQRPPRLRSQNPCRQRPLHRQTSQRR